MPATFLHYSARLMSFLFFFCFLYSLVRETTKPNCQFSSLVFSLNAHTCFLWMDRHRNTKTSKRRGISPNGIRAWREGFTVLHPCIERYSLSVLERTTSFFVCFMFLGNAAERTGCPLFLVLFLFLGNAADRSRNDRADGLSRGKIAITNEWPIVEELETFTTCCRRAKDHRSPGGERKRTRERTSPLSLSLSLSEGRGIAFVTQTNVRAVSKAYTH